MNITLRAITSEGSLILKQSMPWVAKYPNIPAPHDRTIREARFYQMVYPYPHVAQLMPDLLALDIKNRLAVFSDLGEASDFSYLYHEDECMPLTQLEALANWLSKLHKLPFGPEDRAQLTNTDMRLLNHEHIFDFPLNPDNGLELDAITAGLQAEADRLISDREFVQRTREIGTGIYLSEGTHLIHGDTFLGSFLRTPLGLRVIDPEFAFFGRAEFDAGVFAAHLILSHHEPDFVQLWFRHYHGPEGFDPQLANQFAGIEIMRRLIGVAQLPLRADIGHKSRWLELARQLVLTGKF